MIDFTLAPRRNEMIEALGKMIRIESVKSDPQYLMPYGKGVFDALMKMMSLAEHLDFDSVTLFSRMGYVDYGEGDETFAILTHLDVVPAGDGWTVPPFDVTVKDGKIYGRGVVDNKGPAIASLFALSSIKEDCVNLNKRVRLIFGCDEESGWEDITFYKEHGGEIPDMAIAPDAGFPIINAEKGMVQLALVKNSYEAGSGSGIEVLRIDGGDRVNVVPGHCECVLRGRTAALREMLEMFNADVDVPVKIELREDGVLLTSEGKPAHGSTPEKGRNAVAYMLAFLNQLPLKKSHMSDAVYQLAQYVGVATDGSLMGVEAKDASGALTMNLGYIRTTKDGVEAGLDIRYPVTGARGPIVDQVRGKMTEFDVRQRFALDAHVVPEDSPLVQGLKHAYEEITGERAACLTMGGATYARAFPNAVAFGPMFPGQKSTEHQADEHMEVESLIKLADIIANAIMTICT
jgi:succinyl-diaminopimelate desuccinylase